MYESDPFEGSDPKYEQPLYIETLWKVVKWSMKWPYSIQWDHIEMFYFRHTFFLWPSSQTMWINSLVIARQNVPITFIHSETTLR